MSRCGENLGVCECKEKEIQIQKDLFEKKGFKEGKSSDKKDIKISFQAKETKEKKPIKNKEETFFCYNECDYKSKKEATLRIHNVTKHKDHICKECQYELPSFMELLRHIAQHHEELKV